MTEQLTTHFNLNEREKIDSMNTINWGDFQEYQAELGTKISNPNLLDWVKIYSPNGEIPSRSPAQISEDSQPDIYLPKVTESLFKKI